MSTSDSLTSSARTEHAKPVAAQASASDFDQAVQACDFPVLVWALPNGVVWLANQRASELFDVPMASLPGTRHTDLVGPSDSVTGAFDALGSGAVEVVSAERSLRTRQRILPVRVWSRAIELDGSRAVVSLYIPSAEVGRLGRDPTAPWQDFAPLAIGTADLEWRIESVSSDIREIVGIESRDPVGISLLDLVHRDDASELLERRDDGHIVPRSHCFVRLRHHDGSLVNVCVLVAPFSEASSERVAFTLIALPHASLGAPHTRVAELELRLRHIATEVRAAGILDELDTLPATSDHPQLRDLTSRQWEILSRLMRGDRIPTIAEALFVSQSTVRNHLATIYAKFGVHSQAELLAALRRPPKE